MSDSSSGAFVAQVSLLGTATGVVKGNALYSALAVLNLRTAVVAHHYRLSRHNNLLGCVNQRLTVHHRQTKTTNKLILVTTRKVAAGLDERAEMHSRD